MMRLSLSFMASNGNELEMIETLNQPHDHLVVNVGPNNFTQSQVDLQLDDLSNRDGAIGEIERLLASKKYLVEYYL